MEQEIEAKAREIYEASRKRVSGRPAWERLNPSDPYDMGMRETALSQAREAYRKECVASTAKAIGGAS
ncbi:hypothetical protein [Rhizobium sp. MHM7A]|uniref:hypothetical protein n=1 Tax=Rhizobium sp. MHM7A TaxID=2583233 RepID=UPI001106D79A|nr:hypothetical protein [Rhizobium sp. MHM7A]TLX12104.1 hypothetical protein FFR93_16170 [Rhizobium sp. MHM7A]